MGKRTNFRDLLPGDIAHVAGHMREHDRQELFAMVGDGADVLDALAESVLRSTKAWTWTAYGEPIAIFGVAPIALLGGIGAPWLLGTDRVLRFPRVLVREGRRYVAEMLGLFPHLVNYVDARNVVSVRWLARLGFQVHEPQPYGVAGLPFHRFEMRA